MLNLESWILNPEFTQLLQMKTLSEKHALLKLRNLKTDFRDAIRQNYEHQAKDCLTCETKGACCLDAHFVNVHITKLEAVLIREKLSEFPIESQIEKLNEQTYKNFPQWLPLPLWLSQINPFKKNNALLP